MHTATQNEFLTTIEAARLLRLTGQTLRRWRMTGQGPAYHRFGNRILYAREDLTTWVAGCRRRSTATWGAVRPPEGDSR